MIFVTVGTQKFPFDRLFIELDRLVRDKKINEEIIAQIGHSTFVPTSFKTFQFIGEKDVEKYINEARVIITHSGTSSIIRCIKNKKKIIVVPRLKEYGEHVDNHQLEIANVFATKQVVEVVNDMKNLNDAIQRSEEKQYKTLTFDNSRLLGSIENYILSS